jgi:ligand-binding sensor domain-containing protein/signal transduction histidine kinase
LPAGGCTVNLLIAGKQLYRKILIITICLLPLMSWGQQPVKFSFFHLSSSNGLLSNNVQSVIQDADGYIWIGSPAGLQRYDGVRFKTFKHVKGDSGSIVSNLIIQLLTDHKNRLWVLFSDGLAGIFDTHTFKFREAKIQLQYAQSRKSSIRRLVKDDKGNLFVLFAGGEAVMFDEKTFSFPLSRSFIKIPPGTKPADIVQQPGTSKYWIGVQNEGLAVYDHSTGIVSYKGANKSGEKLIDSLPGNVNPGGLFFDKKQRLWFISWGPGYPHLYCYDLKNKKWILYEYNFYPVLKSYHELYGFFEQQDSTVWVRGSRVLAFFDEKLRAFRMVENGYKNERSISYDGVYSLFEDRKNNIWVGTENAGVYRFNPGKEYFNNITHINRNSGVKGNGSVMSFMPTRWGTIIAGAWHDGLYEYDQDFNEIPLSIKGIPQKTPPSAWCMANSTDSNYFWIAAQPGIYRVNQTTRVAEFYNPPELENRTVRQIVQDKDGAVYMAIQGRGVLKWDGKTSKPMSGIRRMKSVPLVMVNKLLLDNKGLLWVATASEGCFVVDPVKDSVVMHLHKDGTGWNKLPEEGVSGILQYDDSTYVITTRTNVLILKPEAKKITQVHNLEELSTFIASLEKDRLGYVWISTTGGLFRYNIFNDMFVWFRQSDGIDNENFTQSASKLLPDGRLLFGGADLFVVFRPDKIDINNSFPDITITDFKVHNQSLPVDSLLKAKNIEFTHQSNSFIIDFSSLTFGTAYIDVKYKLDGLDKDWQMADNAYQAVYSYLPPGSYTFRVRSENAEGASSEKETTISFTVLPPFYRTWWFYSILILFGAGVLYWFDRERMHRKETILTMRSAIADNLHEEVTSTLNNITILSEIARLKADKDIEKSKEYIDQINDKSRKMMYNMEDMLWSINPENDSMEKMLLRMREFAEGHEKDYDFMLDMQMDPRLSTIQLDMLKRQELFFIFKDAMNCLVHSYKAEKAHVSMDVERGVLMLNIRGERLIDDMPAENNCPYLKDIRKRVKHLNARMEFEQDKKFVSMIVQVNT